VLVKRRVRELDASSHQLSHRWRISPRVPPDRRHFCALQPPKRERTMPRTARFLYLILVITTVQQSSSQTCPANFISAPASLSCPAFLSCRTTEGCCGSCSGSDGQCYAYTFGTTCSNTPISCPTDFSPLPSDATGSRPRGSCPASRPYQTTDGCCGACRTTDNRIFPYVCRTTSGTTCSNTLSTGCSSTVTGTSITPPQHAQLPTSFRCQHPGRAPHPVPA